MALSKIKGTVIADDAINADRIADGTVVASDLLDNTITGAKLATDIAISTTGAVALNGTIKLDGNYPVGTNNVALGDSALDDGSLTGGYNTAIGTNALTANTSGTQNTAIGSLVLDSHTTGIGNTAVGYQALTANTTGQYNTAIGRNTMFSNLAGVCNVAVGGNALYNTTASHNTAVGMNALVSNTTANNNTALGSFSLCSNTTGSCNTTVGYQSLCSNTTGIFNTAIGSCALCLVTTNGYNTAVGSGTLRSATGNFNTGVGVSSLNGSTASENTALGYLSLAATTSGGRNVAVGNCSLRSNTTAECNTAVGSFSLQDNTTGCHNTAIGHLSLHNNTTGCYNVAVGLQSLNSNTTTNANVAIGNFSLFNSTASSNTAIGYESLCTNTTGTQNTALGRTAGSTVTTGSNLTLLGYNAEPSSATATNEITLGDANVTDVRIPGVDFYIDGGNVGIGTSSPATSLHLKANNAEILFEDSNPDDTREAKIHTNAGDLIFQVGDDLTGTPTVDGQLTMFDGGSLIYSQSGTNRFNINTSGNVGINQSAPGQKLDVQGIVQVKTATSATRKYRITDSVTGQYFDMGVSISSSQPNLTFSDGADERMRIDSSGHAIIPGGVTLGTSAGTYTAANTLDDYEEGDWTPDLESNTGDNIDNYDSRAGRYTKIGNLVIARCYIDGGTKGTVAGSVMRIGSLPFFPNSTVNYQAGTVGYWDNLDIDDRQLMLSVYAANNFAYLFKTTTDGGGVQVSPGNIQDDCRIAATIIYETDS